MSTGDKISSDELTDLIGRVRVTFGGFEDADALIAEAERFAARLVEVEAERDAAKARADTAERIIRNAHQAIRTSTLAASVALAMFDTRDCGKPSLLDELQAARAELEAARPVVEAADAWRGENNGKGLVLPPTSARIDALIAAVDLHRSIRNLDSTTPEPSFATETLPTTGEKSAEPKIDPTDPTYWVINKVLDELLGTEEEDGAGQGLVADIYLLAQQRDEARAELARLAPTSPSEPAAKITGEHPEARCHRCGGPNIVWNAPSPLWNAVMRGGSINGDDEHDGVVCPVCFAAHAEERGVAGGRWRLFSERTLVELETVTPSGRVWDERTWLWSDALSVSVEPVPPTPTVPGRTERPEGLSAEILDLRGHEITKRHDGTVIRYVLTGVTIPPGTVVGGFDFDPETGAVGWSQVNAGKPPVADVAPVWAGPGCCRAAYESDGHAHDHPSGPRVWAMPRGVRKLSDRHGVVWQWAGGPYFTSGDDPDEETIERLMIERWPLTEVVETNDG